MDSSQSDQCVPSGETIGKSIVTDELFEPYRSCYFCQSFEKQSVCAKCHDTVYPDSSINGESIKTVVRDDPGCLRNDGDPPVELPPEVLMEVFSYLDDQTLWSTGDVCQRWRQVVKTLPGEWRSQTLRRWPLFKPAYPVHDWFSVFSRLIESCFCTKCLLSITNDPVSENLADDSGKIRRRVAGEHRMLVNSHQLGIEAFPLDEKYNRWAVTISGPAGSPYEGGVFHLSLQLPNNYPLAPPVVRFVTKIFHPNVTRHGDVHISLADWTASWTLLMMLVHIQSLLSCPDCNQCAEKEVGRIFQEDRDRFETIARSWTWRYAVHHLVAPDIVST